MTTFLLLSTGACVLVGAGLTAWMFHRDDEFAGLAGLTVLITGAWLAAVYAGITS